MYVTCSTEGPTHFSCPVSDSFCDNDDNWPVEEFGVQRRQEVFAFRSCLFLKELEAAPVLPGRVCFQNSGT